MSQDADSIVAYLNVLHNHKQLISKAYHNNGVHLDSENQRAIRRLQQHRVLLPYVQDEYRLSPSLSRHLDEVFQRQRNYALSGNFGEQINRLEYLVDEYLEACHQNRAEDRDTYENDFESGVFELREGIDSMLLFLRTLTENRFANVSTLDEKRRQNEYYIHQAEKISDALRALQQDGLSEQLSGSDLLTPLFGVYQYQLQNMLPEWRASLLDITSTLKNYLYRLRQVEPEARRIRNFAHFLNKNRDYQVPDAEDLLELPAWSARFDGLRLKIHPDLSENRTREALVEVAQSIPPAPVTIDRERKAGSLVDEGHDKATVTIKPNPVQLAFHHYVGAAIESAKPLSALQWKQQHQEFSSLKDEMWLLYVLHATQMLSVSTNARWRKLQVERREAPVAYGLSGNITVSDISVWKDV